MSGSDEAPRGGTSPWRRPAVILAALAVSLAVFTFLRPEPEATITETSTEADSALASEFSGVATVSDGDTIRIGDRRFQLDGIIAPDRSVRCGDINVYRASTDALREVTRSQQVTCRISGQPDAEGQDTAQCRVDEIDLNQYMVANGWARDWPQQSGGAYADEEATARAAQRGVWSASCPATLWDGSPLNE